MYKNAMSFFLTLALLSLVITACTPKEDNKLEVFHWWTAGGERESADIMFAVFTAANPGVQVVEQPMAGGGGVWHRITLQQRMSAGLPPDTFMTLGGAELKAYVDEGYLEPLDDLWDELGYYDALPKPLADAVSIDGHPYVVPLNMHIQNILYYNKVLFDQLGIGPPTTFDELLQAAETIKQFDPELFPLSLGTVEKWEAPFVLDSIILEVGGPEYYVKLHKGEIDVRNDPTYRTALEKLKALAPYINPTHSYLTWDESCGLLVSEESAMVIMGTWAIGYFQSQGWTPGVEFGAVTFPQAPDRMLLFHPDTYGLAKGALHPETTKAWLRTLASPALQIPTDVSQGGMFARVDIDPASFPDPIRQELQTYVRNNPDKLILDQHGSIAPFEFTQAYWDVIAAFVDDPTIDTTMASVANLFTTHSVKEEAAWYHWP